MKHSDSNTLKRKGEQILIKKNFELTFEKINLLKKRLGNLINHMMMEFIEKNQNLKFGEKTFEFYFTSISKH